MFIKQISIFVENKPGRLAEITQILAQNEIDIRALSIADTTDYGILRLIVSKPDEAVAAIKKEGLAVSANEVLAIGIPDVPGGFANAINILADGGIGVEYAYAFITPSVGNAFVIIRVEDNEKAAKTLEEKGIQLIGQKDIFN
ncbi:MAG TPA: ACT domain-containing protein [Clostridia bacterium]|nr:ACT domain-containing protein [Clostridia bacterium]